MPWVYPECKKCGGFGCTDPWLDPAPCGACGETGEDTSQPKEWIDSDPIAKAVERARGYDAPPGIPLVFSDITREDGK